MNAPIACSIANNIKHSSVFATTAPFLALNMTSGTSARLLTSEAKMSDAFFRMSLDLNTLLRDWPHEPGASKVRKIIGLDGREKLQLRIDLGVLQMEVAGRPDGQRPHNCESLLVYHQRRAERAEARGETYELNPEQCNDLQQEGIQYYHRYLSLFQITDFPGVIDRKSTRLN